MIVGRNATATTPRSNENQVKLTEFGRAANEPYCEHLSGRTSPKVAKTDSFTNNGNWRLRCCRASAPFRHLRQRLNPDGAARHAVNRQKRSCQSGWISRHRHSFFHHKLDKYQTSGLFRPHLHQLKETADRCRAVQALVSSDRSGTGSLPP